MKKFDFLGIEFEGCGIFNSIGIEQKSRVSNTQTTVRYVVELPLELGGTNFVNGVATEIHPNSLFFIKPGSLRYTIFPLRCLSLHFKTNDKNIIEIFDEIPTVLTLQNRSKIYSCFLEMIQIFTNNPPHREILFMNKFFKFIDLIFQECSIHSNISANSEQAKDAVKKAKGFIDAHYNERITLEELSDMVSLSPIYFQRIFASITGKTPHKYLLDKRLQSAKELLLVSNFNLTEISDMCGFSSQSRFNVVFKQAEGITPTEYKKKNRIENY